MDTDFFSMYLEYNKETEVPTFFHRWAAITSLGAYLGRGYSLPFGHTDLYPNLYTMLIGSAGTRKSTAIKSAKRIIQLAGYETIAAERTTKEKFLLDLSGEDAEDNNGANDATKILEKNLWGNSSETDPPAETFIMADEFNDFIGTGNVEFISLLGTLWDFTGVYQNKVKNSKSVSIANPTISILGGNTPTGLALAFPPEMIGQGFFSRLLLIHGEVTGKKIAFPTSPDPQHTRLVVETLQRIRSMCVGRAEFEPAAKQLLEKIYVSWEGIDDVRFDSYSNRRFTHLLKLVLIHAAAALSTKIREVDVIRANTVLSFTESLMPRALGEFGKAKNSGITHNVLVYLEKAMKPKTLQEIWKDVASTDLSDIRELGEILRSLQAADKIQTLKTGVLIKKKPHKLDSDFGLDYSYLTNQEKGLRP